MGPLAEVLGESPGVGAVVEQVRQLLERRSAGRRLPPILIQGETGTGKGLVAKAIHRAGPRSSGPFVHVNCAAIPETMLEAELFGFERGAFTDAKQPKAGLFQAAHRGTLFLDEVGLLPEGLQGKLLTAVEEQAVRRLGSTRTEPVDVWILAANSEDLQAAAKSRHFREDLYHRLAVLTLWLPPLRDRGRDALLLAEHFLARACHDYGLPPKTLAPGARAALAAYHWPGNIRELSNVIERVTLLFDQPDVTAEMLALSPRAQREVHAGPVTQRAAFADQSENGERERLLEALRQTDGNVSRAATWLNVSRNTLRYRMEKHGLGPAASQAPQRSPVRTEIAETPAATSLPKPLPPVVRWERRHLAMLRAALIAPSEELARDTSDALEAAIEKVRLFGGRVEELSPGAIAATFGIEPVENAAHRAALAARAIMKAAHRAREGEHAASKLAIHVASVLVGHVDGVARIELDSKRALCDVLEALTNEAGPGSITVSAAARAFLERRLELVPATTQRQAAQGAYQLSGRERVGLAERGASFVGRQHELELLRRRFEAAARGQGQVIGIVGEAGIGKSRLLVELRQALAQESITYLEGRCVSYGGGTPYLPILELVRSSFGITDADSPEDTAKNASAALRDLGMTPAEALPYILHLLGVEERTRQLSALEPELIKARTHDIVQQVMLKSSERRPVMVAVEDLHWSDNASEEYFATLVDAIAAARIVLVFSYRPGYRPPWIAKSYATQIALQPLPAEESARIARAVLGTRAAQPLVQGIVAKGAGNPFFVEELAWALHAQAGATSDLAVPATIQEAILARLNALPRELKHLLQCAAVLGAQFPAALLGAVTDLPEGELRRRLADLLAAELLYEKTVVGGREYAFKHALTEQTVYENLLAVERRDLHARTVACIERLHAGRLGEHVEHLAHHARHGETWDKAASYLRQAGAKAAGRSAHLEAAAFYEQALAALSHLPENRQRVEQAIDLRFDLRTCLHLLGESERILEHLRQAQTLAETLDEQKRLGWISSYLMQYYRNTGDQARALETGQRAIAIAEKLGDFALQVTTNTHLGVVYGTLGDYRRAVEILRKNVESLAGARLGERFGMAGLPAVLSRGYLASYLAELGAFPEALQRAQEGLEIAESANDAYSIAFACALVGQVGGLKGSAEPVIPTAERGLELCRAMNFRILLPPAACWLGSAYALAGRFGDAIPLLERAVEAGVLVKRKDRYSIFLTRLGEAHLEAGHFEQVLERAGRALRLAREQGERGHEAHALRLLAESASRAVILDAAAAEASYGQAMELAQELGMRPLMAHCRLGLGRLYRRMENFASARAQLDAAVALYREMDMLYWLEKAQAALASLG
jgi:transcriptional regulator with AAA-type ATPase domain/tetratricopeptide (TPR) repeat protein